jgi:hypothetical protein
MDEIEYLEPNFNPARLRVADLRRILIFHNVDFPSSAKKAQLVSLFQDEITPIAKTLLEEKLSVRPSCEGIEIVTDSMVIVQPQNYLYGVVHQIFRKLRNLGGNLITYETKTI